MNTKFVAIAYVMFKGTEFRMNEFLICDIGESRDSCDLAVSDLPAMLEKLNDKRYRTQPEQTATYVGKVEKHYELS